MKRRTARLRPSMIDSRRGSRRPTSERRGGYWMNWSSQHPRLELTLPRSRSLRRGSPDASDAISDQLWIDDLVEAVFNRSTSAHERDKGGNHRLDCPT